MTLGKNSRNRAFIRLTKAWVYWQPGWSGQPEDIAAFLHEYAHYLHNFSTGAGVNDFLYELETDQLLLMTVGSGGTSKGISALEPRWKEHYRLLRQLRGRLRGDFHLPPLARQMHRRSPQIQYVGHDAREETLRSPSSRQRLSARDPDAQSTHRVLLQSPLHLRRVNPRPAHAITVLPCPTIQGDLAKLTLQIAP